MESIRTMSELSREAKAILKDLSEASILLDQSEVLFNLKGQEFIIQIAQLIGAERHHANPKAVTSKRASSSKTKTRADAVVSEARKNPKSPLVPSKVPTPKADKKAKANKAVKAPKKPAPKRPLVPKTTSRRR